MAWPVVIKPSGGLPVTVASNGRGTPMTVATNGYGIPVTFAANGLPVVGVAPSASPVSLPTVSAAPTAVWGTAKVISAYAGPAARVQRISDDVEADLTFGASKFMDVSVLGIATHQYKTIYDQTGNGNHITMATKANQPAASNLTPYNACPAIHFDSSALAVGVRTKWMACATGPVTEKSAFTMFLLIVPNFSFNDNYFMSQPHTATTLSLFTQSTNVGIRGNNTTPFNSTRRMPRIQPHVLRWRGGPTGKQFGINGVTQLISTAPVAGAETGIAFGHHVSTASYDGEFDLMAAVVYNATLSDADCLLVEAALYAQCNVRTTATTLLLFDGDSRTEGNGVTINRTWPKQVLANFSSAHAINMGLGGQTLSTMAGAVAARVNALYDAAYPKNIVIMGGPGINDFTANRTALQMQTDVTTYTAGLHANQSLIVATVPIRDTSTGAQNTERTTYNTWLKANYASLKTGARLVDLDALWPVYNAADYIDIVHFNDSGQAKWAAAFLPAIQALVA